jgi:erythromycin esterase-like protein
MVKDLRVWFDVSTSVIQRHLRPLNLSEPDYDELIGAIGDASLVLIGEASHGTHEFYQQRAELTKLLIEQRGFHAVAAEADWPAALRVHRYVNEETNDRSANEALADFTRFPAWMWRNTVMIDFVDWLQGRGAGFFGIDLYSLHASIEAVLTYLDRIDPEAAQRARNRYACFDHFGHDPQAYGYASTAGIAESCEDDVVKQLLELRAKAADYARRDGRVAEDEFFFAEQNARLTLNAERYYRSMFRGRVSSWNLRDEHMTETIEELVRHLGKRVRQPKLVVWAHNSHLGDARATEMGWQGEWNVGQLVRERFGKQAYLIGFSTYEGTVTAASDWDGPPERKRVRPGMKNSYERLFHEVGEPAFWLNLREPELQKMLTEERLQRAIGVIYLPRTERRSHYFHARLAQQFDALLHFDITSAVRPLEIESEWEEEEVPETFPSGL